MWESPNLWDSPIMSDPESLSQRSSLTKNLVTARPSAGFNLNVNHRLSNSVSEGFSDECDLYVEKMRREAVLFGLKHIERVRQFQNEVNELQDQRKRFQDSQNKVLERINHFKGVIDDNRGRYNRARETIIRERQLARIRQAEFAQLEVDLKATIALHEELKKKCASFKIYEDFLKQVTKLLPDDYLRTSKDSLTALISRYDNLLELYTKLTSQYENVTKNHFHIRSLYKSTLESSHLRTICLNTELVGMSKTMDSANAEVTTWNTWLQNDITKVPHLLRQLQTVLKGVELIATKCDKFSQKEPNLERTPVEHMLVIKRFLESVPGILEAVQKEKMERRTTEETQPTLLSASSTDDGTAASKSASAAKTKSNVKKRKIRIIARSEQENNGIDASSVSYQDIT